MNKFVLMVCCLFLGAAGCDENKINTVDLKGTWSLTDSSRRQLPHALQGELPKMVIHENGTFNAASIPTDLFGEEEKIRLTSGSGTWKWREDEEGGRRLELDFLAIEDKNVVRTPFAVDLLASGEENNLRLYYFRGDPDEGRRIEFARSIRQ